MKRLLLLSSLVLSSSLARAETPAQWIALAKRVHGGFGSYLPLGIRIGLDARKRLEQNGRLAGMRDLDVTYLSFPSAPCACVADGLMLSTGATPGQGTLHVESVRGPFSPKVKSLPFGRVEVRSKTTGQSVGYEIPASTGKLLDKWNATLGERGRYDAVMNAPAKELFTRVEERWFNNVPNVPFDARK